MKKKYKVEFDIGNIEYEVWWKTLIRELICEHYYIKIPNEPLLFCTRCGKTKKNS